MNSALLMNIARFILLLLAQVLIFNRMDLFGFVNPFPYILFIILYPVNGNKTGLLVASFFLGLIMDMFWNSGGVHAAACLILAYFRPAIFKFSFGLSYEYQTVKLNDSLTPERFSFILIAVVIHHFTLFILEIFKLSSILDILVRTVLSTLFTIITSIIIIYLIKPSKR
ncbi:MAG: rod shape-determining protein MreD [Flavobacterium sp.]|jgi:rod shape-determining protein MreD|uniref:Rod shape-determining protein MreD n=1 Tax=Flavobacterium macrobrachii TaxID=591204 RepID=A0ABS2CZE5_9FLAO|nr:MULTISPECIES: rod shape-determining protein MreD [Flavobacterium]MBM6499525.1 rod shape-determining protein MreD [Flavobacterium macrobrachii]MCZ8091661.1 rod shape-determining protein MreD [Flavobacterium sp.]MCZ8332554.1 rod shape-determining protein MreD [Flavobacterium sp.]PZO31591.1 MAG: rod shape-determining protein MreD [Flavobacteriaceae bacterium]